MKLLLCFPSQLVSHKGVMARPYINIPLGILSIAANIRANDWPGEIQIYDARLSTKLHQEENGETIFGDTDAEMLARIKAEKPDVVGISNMFSSQVEKAFRMAELARQAAPEASIIFGGPHASSFPIEVLEKGYIDYVVMGEGEERFLHLLGCIERNEKPEIQGVLGVPEDAKLLRSNKKAQINFIDDVDQLPLPAYDLVDMNRYFELQSGGFSPRLREWGARAVTILSSRGCPHKCIFCSIQGTMGYKWRYHSPEYVKNHIHHLRDKYRIDFIHFEDDNFTHDPARYDAILDILLDLNPIILWDTPNGVRGDSWTFERVKKTKQAGCQFLNVAIESADQNVIDTIVKKRLDLSKVDDLMIYCQAIGLRLNAFYIIGFPGETLANIMTTIRFALSRYSRYGVYPMLQPLIPLPGTEAYDIITDNHMYEGDLEYKYNQVKTDQFDRHVIKRKYKNFMWLKILIFIKRTFTSRPDFSYNLKLMFNYREAVYSAINGALFGKYR